MELEWESDFETGDEYIGLQQCYFHLKAKGAKKWTHPAY